MADNTKVIGIKIVPTGQEKLIAGIANAKAEVSKLSQELKDLQKEQKKASDPKDIKQYEERINEVRRAQAIYRKEIKDTEKEIKRQNDSLLATSSAADSYKGLEAQLRVLRAQFKGLSKEERDSELGKNLTADIQRLDDELLGLSESIRQYGSNVGRYKKDVLQALREFGQENELQKQLQLINNETEELRAKAKKLTDEYEATFKQSGEASEQARRKIAQQLTAINKQIQENIKTTESFNKTTSQQGVPSGKTIKRASKIVGLGGLGEIAGGAADLSNLLGGLGGVATAAFGVFAAGGLVFQGIQALSDLNKQIGATRAEVRELSGASGEELEKFTTDVRGIAGAFGATEEEILTKVAETQEATGKSFEASLADVEAAYINTAKSSGVLVEGIEAQLKANKELAGAQSELAKLFNETGINTGTFVTELKTGLFTVLIQIFNALKPVVSGFIDFGKSLGTLIKSVSGGSRAGEIFGKVLKAALVPARIGLTIFKALAGAVVSITKAVADFISNSPIIQGAIEAIGAGFSALLDLIIAIPDTLLNALTSIQNFGRDALSAITGGLVDDAATAEAAAQARDAGQAIGEAFAEQFVEGTASIETQLAANLAGTQAFIAARSAGKSLGEAFAEAQNAAIAEAERLGAKRKTEPTIDGQTTKQLDEANKKRIEALENARKEREAAAQKLLEAEEDNDAKFRQVIRESAQRTEELQSNLTGSAFSRQIRDIQRGTQRQIEASRESIQQEAQERINQLKEAESLVNSDESVRARFGDVEEIRRKIQQASEAASEAISQETASLIQSRDKQIKELTAQRQRAIEEAAASVDAATISDAIAAAQARLTSSEGNKAAIELRFSTDEQALNAEVERLKTRLSTLRDAGLIDEQEYRESLRVVESDALETAARIAEQRIMEEQMADQAILANRLVLQELELAQLKKSIAAEQAERLRAIDEQAQEGLLSEQQAADARAQIQQAALDQQLSAEEAAAQSIANLKEEQRTRELAQSQELAAAQDEINALLFANQRARQEEYFQQLQQAAQNFNDAFQQGVEIADNLFAVSDNKRKERIAERYQEELQRANGNATAIAEAEQRRDEALAKIEQEAAKRKQRIDTAQAIINGALAVTNILATTPDPTGLFTAARIAAAIALTATQVAAIQSAQFAEGGELPAGGQGEIKGRSHRQGGVRFTWNGSRVEAEGGEWMTDGGDGSKVIINRKSTQRYKSLLGAIDRVGNFQGRKQLLSAINQSGGGVAFAVGGQLPAVRLASPVYAAAGASLSPVGAQDNANIIKALIEEQRAAIFGALETARQTVTNIRVINDPRDTIIQGQRQSAIYKTTTLTTT